MVEYPPFGPVERGVQAVRGPLSGSCGPSVPGAQDARPVMIARS